MSRNTVPEHVLLQHTELIETVKSPRTCSFAALLNPQLYHTPWSPKAEFHTHQHTHRISIHSHHKYFDRQSFMQNDTMTSPKSLPGKFVITWLDITAQHDVQGAPRCGALTGS